MEKVEPISPAVLSVFAIRSVRRFAVADSLPGNCDLTCCMVQAASFRLAIFGSVYGHIGDVGDTAFVSPVLAT